jgi:hypothetical protein
MNIGRVLARLTIGGLFIGHGTQKLFGWFGGPGIDGTTGNTNGGYEFNLALIAAAAALIDAGPGSPSVDDALGLDLKGGGWALAALAGGIAGSTATMELARRTSAEQEPATRSGRFERAAEGARQDLPAESPA